jgi:S-layer homology domain
VVVLGFGLTPTTPTGGTPTFTDVPADYYAYTYIETGYKHGILSGFDAATCTANGAVAPCYLPGLNITRAQLTKLVVNAAGYPLYTPSDGQSFSDVGPNNVFYASIETAAQVGVVKGYADGTFKPNNNIRRDEMAQIVYKGVITPARLEANAI